MRIFGNNLFGSIDYQNKISIEDKINRLKEEIENADAIVIGAGAGLSTSAGFTYSGERFLKYFKDFADKYGIRDIYSGGFYPFKSKEEYWAWWSRHIYVNRYVDVPKPVYRNLLELVKDKDYFVLTTNVDHQFQRAGFDKKRMFYTQGDYGLWQCSDPCRQVTYDNEEQVKEMLLAQGFTFGDEGELVVPINEAGEPDFSKVKMEIPTLHKAAKEAFSKIKGKIPTIKELNAEYAQVLAEKKKTYSEYRQARQEMKDYQTAKYNIDRFLQTEEQEKQAEKQKQNTKTR